MTKIKLSRALWYALGTQHIPGNGYNSQKLFERSGRNILLTIGVPILTFFAAIAACQAFEMDITITVGWAGVLAVLSVLYILRRYGLLPQEGSIVKEWKTVRKDVSRLAAWSLLKQECTKDPSRTQNLGHSRYFLTCAKQVMITRERIVAARKAAQNKVAWLVVPQTTRQ